MVINLCLRIALVLLLLVNIACASNIIKTLPGYSSELPFTLETGYIGVGENEEVQLFYYFVQSQRNPVQDPLLFWMTGGPGCSSLTALFFENGPLFFEYANYNGSLPTISDNPYAWTKGLNIIYLDAPVGAGFSYSKTQSGYVMNDHKFVAQSYEFLRKWLVNHTDFIENILYVGGDSYSGIPIPMIVQTIVDGIVNGSEPLINLKGYVLGNPVTDTTIDMNARITYAHRLTLISDQLYKSAKTSCNEDYVNVDPSNEACLSDLDAIDQLTSDINLVHILEPYCSNALPTPNDINKARRYLKDISRGFLSSPPNGPALWCRNYFHMMAYIWANNKGVQDALGVRKGTKTLWQYCNTTLAYTKEMISVTSYHQNLTNSDLRALIYSGDHDMSIPHIGTQKWINSLNLTSSESWRVWSVDGQTTGYTKKLINEKFSLTFATVKGAGHFAAEYMVKECGAMIDRWMAYYPL